MEDSLFAHELKVIAGVDEAGRGACAGPLVAAAVALDHTASQRLLALLGDRKRGSLTLDSKAMSEKDREYLFSQIEDIAVAIEVVIIEADEIDRFGLQAMNEGAMRRAISQLAAKVDYALTDGYPIEGLAMPSLAVWKGDAVSLSVGAASIIAKVRRDRIMVELDGRFPGYGFASHKGYSSKAHMDAIKELGVLPIHRRSYSNVAKLIAR
ncbi:MAG: ribonuclease HII [Actinobacteria bacterium]|nr:ribonuclease HII [Actinomycetota bacterium]